MRRVIAVVAICVVLSPFIFVEGLYRYGLSLAGEPHLVSAGHMERVHRVLWAMFEDGPMEHVEPIWPWRVNRLLSMKSKPTPGRALAATVAARQVRFTWRGDRIKGVLAEVSRTIWLTRNATGEQLTSAAADSLYFGRGAHGVEQGAQVWFEKPASELSWAQAAMLVGLEWSPTTNDPTCHPERALTRRHFVLTRLRERSLITQQEFDQADGEALLPAGAPPCTPNPLDSPPDGDLEIVPVE